MACEGFAVSAAEMCLFMEQRQRKSEGKVCLTLWRHCHQEQIRDVALILERVCQSQGPQAEFGPPSQFMQTAGAHEVCVMLL